jgi:hypothetical protein
LVSIHTRLPISMGALSHNPVRDPIPFALPKKSGAGMGGGQK